jgi:hypothetical protein
MGATGCLVRLTWVLLGNAIIALCFVGILRQRDGFPSVSHAFLLGTVVVVIGLRYVDIRWLGGQTATGDPATMAHWRTYALSIGLVGLAAWGLAHVVAHIWR